MKKLVSLILILVMALSLVACFGEKIVWEDIILGDMLPVPPVNKGKVHTNASDDLWVNINDVSEKQFNDYVKLCKEKGYTIDCETSTNSYEAYNTDGYKLSISHYGSNGDMNIQLDAPMEMSTITWPTSAAGKQLPIPKSTNGKFSYEHDDNFYVYVGNTSKTDYDEYVNACSEKGFNIDYGKDEKHYYAKNSEGWNIDIRYVGNNIMSIYINAPKKDSTPTPTQASTPTPTPKTDSSNNGSIDPDFKAAMDSYEKFMDEYVAFMKKYKANPSDLSLLTEYANYMSKYADFVKDFEKWEDEEMNAAETAYYIDVQARVSKKLLEVAS